MQRELSAVAPSFPQWIGLSVGFILFVSFVSMVAQEEVFTDLKFNSYLKFMWLEVFKG